MSIIYAYGDEQASVLTSAPLNGAGNLGARCCAQCVVVWPDLAPG